MNQMSRQAMTAQAKSLAKLVQDMSLRAKIAHEHTNRDLDRIISVEGRSNRCPK